jgi:hypothetical protein
MYIKKGFILEVPFNLNFKTFHKLFGRGTENIWSDLITFLWISRLYCLWMK